MAFLDIFRRTCQPETQHPLFGRIVYQGDNTWELGKAAFPPVGHDVEVIIQAGAEGPSEAHVRFWRELIERWPALQKACEPILRQALAGWIDTPERGDIWARVDVESLTVYPETPPDHWELMFWCEEAGHWPTFVMRGWTPADCFVDG